MGIEALLLSQVITITGSTGQVVTKQADGSLAMQDAAGGGIGGSTGATDNAILRADGTGGATLQNSGVTISDNNEVLIVSGAASAVPFRLRAAASQTGNLQEWQSSAGAVIAVVTASGGVSATTLTVTSGSLNLTAFQWITAGGVAHVGIGAGRFYGNSVQIDSFSRCVLLQTTAALYGWGSSTTVEFGFYRDAANESVLKTPAGVRGKLRLGTLNLSSLPTSDPVVAGEIWNDSGTLKISAG